MATITDITKQKKKGRVNVFLDGEFYCGIDEFTALSLRIAVGKEYDEDELKEIVTESENEARSIKPQIRVVPSAYRARNKKYLSDKEYPPEIVDYAVTKLAEYGYVNDFRFCREYVRAYSVKAGVNKIRADLMRLGAKREAIDEARRNRKSVRSRHRAAQNGRERTNLSMSANSKRTFMPRGSSPTI
ncbi:MAG: hypothetical protein ACLUSP_10275 [Christensenellales bacterium]